MKGPEFALYNGTRCVYVGKATAKRGLAVRLREHTKDRLSSRWNQFTWFGVRPVNSRGRLGAQPTALRPEEMISIVEAILIEGLEPPLNRRQGDGLDGQEFIQDPDPTLANRRTRETLDALVRRAFAE